MFHHSLTPADIRSQNAVAARTVGGSPAFWMCKRGFDILCSLVLLPIVALFSVALLLLNPFFNKGPLFYFEERMGRHCKPFKIIKFRTIRNTGRTRRGPEDPIEAEHIPLLGRVLRASRLDELPQTLNVILGEMSLIGPRPEYYDHAKYFLSDIPGYRDRHVIRPGISGLAQVELGYVIGLEATRSKTEADLVYIHNAGFFLDTVLFFRTIKTILLCSETIRK